MPRHCGHADTTPGCGICKRYDSSEKVRKYMDRSTAHDGRTITPPPVVRTGPGTELKRLLVSLGLGMSQTCGCAQRQAQMDYWGVQGCLERRNEIEEWLRSEAKKVGWMGKLKAGTNAVLQGVVLNPFDPAPGLLDEAVRRASS